MEKFNLPVHEHPLYRLGANYIRCNLNLRLDCDGCLGEGHMGDGFRCSYCRYFYLHRKCGESAREINHPSHPQHPLQLLVGRQLCEGKRCHLCGVSLKRLCYHCSICDFTVDTGCVINPPPLPNIEQPDAHEHPLTLIMSTDDTKFTCHICCEDRKNDKYFYLCSLCDFFFHIECVSLSPEINHPCHPRHLLKFLRGGSDPSDRCSLCGQDMEDRNCYRCTISNFTLDLICVKNPPPLALVSPKTHKHRLSLMPRHVIFTCNACGMPGNQSPYACVQCNFMIHVNCIDLPGVILINRHDHRISHTYDLGLLGNLNPACGVCHRTVDSFYGAYSCVECKNYVVHSRCATKSNCWDGRDLEGEAEEIEDVAPFKVIGDGLIEHFSHEEHAMKLVKEGSVHERTRECKACIKPIGAAKRFYKCTCTHCDYILDEKCANLPRKIRTLLRPDKPTLVGGARYFRNAFCCISCGGYSSGFRYKLKYGEIDLKCISTSDRIERVAHQHPLYFFEESFRFCKGCCKKSHTGYECVKEGCEFVLLLDCAASPDTVKHKSDDHTLHLCYLREDEYNKKYWCDICEKQLDYSKSKQYYACDDCGTTLHTKCVLGDLLQDISVGTIVNHLLSTEDTGWQMSEYMVDEDLGWQMSEYMADEDTGCSYQFEVVSNTGINRPLCCVCLSRCTFSLVLKTYDNFNRYICSRVCLYKFRPPTADDH